MFHRFSNITGRVVAAANLQAPLVPIRPIPLHKATGPVTYDPSVKLSTVPEYSVRCQSARAPDGSLSTLSPKIRQQQKLFQEDNDIPVYLKGGPTDKIIFLTTMGLCVFGFVMGVSYLYVQANPKKNR